eukprot:1868402-Rhodomonas_salina.4
MRASIWSVQNLSLSSTPCERSWYHHTCQSVPDSHTYYEYGRTPARLVPARITSLGEGRRYA